MTALLIRPSRLLLLLASLTALPSPAGGQQAARAPLRGGTWYTVTIEPHDRRSVQVEARIELTDSVLIMYPEGADHVPDGWASYLRGLTATTDAGRAVRLRRAGRDRWIVPAPRPPAVRLRYEVVLHHDAGFWPFGSKEAAYVRDDGAFLTGRALFIAQYRMPPALVRVTLPPRWRLATPWVEVEGDSGTYRVPHVTELLQVGMLAGRHQQRRLLLEGTTVILAVGHSLPNTLDLFEETLAPAMRGAAAMFGGTPRGKFVVIANADSYDGGTAFTRSFDVVFREPPTLANRPEWAHVIVHELLHLWLGGALNTPEGEQEYWFTEGATDYLANLLELRAGIVTREQFLDRLANHVDRYRKVQGTMSLRRAGEDKATRYDLVYSGGLLAAMALDVALWRASDGRMGIEELLRRLYAEHGRTARPFRFADLQRHARAIAGDRTDALLAGHVDGATPLAVDATFSALGWELRSDTTGGTASRLLARPDATAEQRALERRVLGVPVR